MICSFDLAKKQHAYHVLDSSRNLLIRGKVPHSLEGVEQLLERLECLKRKNDCDRIIFFMEGASHFWMPIASLLVRKGYEYRLVENKAVGHQLYSPPSDTRSPWWRIKLLVISVIWQVNRATKVTQEMLDISEVWAALCTLLSHSCH
jgi:hypothetical protein